MDLSDIQYIIELLESSIHNQEWDGVHEAIEILQEQIEPDLGEDED